VNKLFFIIFVFLFSFKALACPESYEQVDYRVEWMCQTLIDGSDYREKKTLSLESGDFIEVDFFKDSKKPFRRDVYQTKYGLLGKYFFTYISESESDFKFKSIKVYDFSDHLIAEQNVDVSVNEIESMKNEVSLKSPKVLIIDSGFNYTHSDLHGKHYVNQAEIIDGIDNDEDGLIDNLTTYNGSQAAGGSIDYSFNKNQYIQLPTKGAAFTHGGFVSSVAMKGVNDLSYLGAGGDIHSPVYLYRLLNEINKHDIRFTNMSFGFGDRSGLSLVDPDSIEAVEGIMRSSFTTLHIIAAGNGNRNFDENSYSEYPACLNLRNKVTVGALDTDKLQENLFVAYKKASFSNTGYRCVDVMAPGVDMLGAGIGDTYMKASGTSVSSPFVLNTLLKMYEKLDSLTVREYKEILLKTVFVPLDEPFEVRSGGIVFPKRAMLAIDKINQGMSIEASIWSAREELTEPGELRSRSLLTKLWSERRL